MSSVKKEELLEIIRTGDNEGLSEFFDKTFTNLPPEEQAAWTSQAVLESPTSPPAQLLVAAVRAEAPEAFARIWDKLYAWSSEPQIPFECLRQAARCGNIELARVFTQRDPRALSRSPPPVAHGRPGPGQILIALLHRKFSYVDFMLSTGITLDHEWPRVRILRQVVAWEQTDQELLELARWCVQRGARIKGAGALRRISRLGITDVATVLLEAGADVEDLDDDSPAGQVATQAVESALMGAVRAGQFEMAKLLVSKGANIHLENAVGETPSSLARTLGRADMVRVFDEAKS